MDFHILTLIPEILKPYFNESILGRAQKEGGIRIFCHQLRDYAANKHQSVDDRPYGGGAGMVFKPDVVVPAVRDIKAKHGVEHVIYLSPKGAKFNHQKAKELSKYKSILLLCGRYEGIDERVLDLVVDEEISIGDYVITGGELAAQVVVDAVSRFVPQVIGNEEAPKNESFADGFLEHPHYTRPAEYEGLKVPEVLQKGDHKAIGKWRQQQSEEITKERRPDLFRPHVCPVYMALVHHPVVNKNGELVTTSITNFDIHDLCRTSKTYGIEKCFMITPVEAQQGMVRYIKNYWMEGFGATYNETRKEALDEVEVAASIEETCLTIEKNHGSRPLLVATSARPQKKTISFNGLQALMRSGKKPVLVLFGTGYGLATEALDQAQYLLEPIKGSGNFNHLPVRAAVAIIMDRLLGR